MSTLNYESLFSPRAQRMEPSAIRRLVALTKRPGIISFAGGWPAAELFPTAEVGRIAAETMADDGAAALQYGPTNGDLRLLTEIGRHLQAAHGLFAAGIDTERMMITTGAQQAIYLLAAVFAAEGDTVVVEAPSYVGGLGVLRTSGAEVVEIGMDEAGMDTAVLADKLAAGLRPKFVYTIPDFQNPTGVTLSLDRRRHLLRLAREYGFLIVEDAPYSDLRYEGEPVPPLAVLDESGRYVVHLGSFSKIFAPLRVGWTVAHPDLIAKLGVAKQSIDLCTPSFTQAIAYRFCREGRLQPQIDRTRDLYRRKRTAMLAALAETMPPAVTWTRPEGGMFVWLGLPPALDADVLFYEAIDHDVAYVIGSAFYATDDAPRNCLRLNFVTPDEEQIGVGIARLADVIRAALAR